MAKIFVDGREYEVRDGQNLLQACLSLGFDLPYFCWHPAMGSVGACRQCAVKQFQDEHDTTGKIVMACMTPADHGTRIAIDDPQARAFRASVIEWLMTSHPHDCPICDEGGECHLQDMTVMTRHVYRHYRFRKRTHRNQYLGPFVNHEMNRCIQCYRCVRFYRGTAGGRDLDVFASASRVYFGRDRDGVLENEFSGNLVEVCPTGVFTDKTLKKHYTRPWDLQTAPSVCVHCGLGCNTIPGERYGSLRRVRNRYHHEVNGYFLCDRGRYGYEFVNSDRRLRTPLRSQQDGERPPDVTTGAHASEASSVVLETQEYGKGVPAERTAGISTAPVSPKSGKQGSRTHIPVNKAEALSNAASLLGKPDRVIGIGSPRASQEANFALRELVGPERFYQGISNTERGLLREIVAALGEQPAAIASLRDVSESDAALVLGEDVTNTAPLLALAIRQILPQEAVRRCREVHLPFWNDAGVREVAQDERSMLFLATPNRTKLEEVAARACQAAPDDLARLGFAVAAEVSRSASPSGGPSAAAQALSPEMQILTVEIARRLAEAEQPLVVSGAGCGSVEVVRAAASVVRALRERQRPARLCLTVPECNSLGLALLGGEPLADAFRRVEQGQADTVIILENDLYRRAEAEAVDALLRAASHVIVLDHLDNPTVSRAELVLPAATFAEASGTIVNNESRAQRFVQVFVAPGEVQASWRWLRDLALAAGHPACSGWNSLDDLVASLAAALPMFAPVRGIAPHVDFRERGSRVPRQPHRYSGRTAMLANVSVHEPRPADDPESPLSFSMEGFEGKPPTALIPRFWAPGWNSVQALNKFQSEVGGPLRGGDPGRRLLGGEQPEGGPGSPQRAPGPCEGSRRPGGPEIRDGAFGASHASEGEWVLVPIHRIFGSEELSALSPGIAERTDEPYVVVHPEDAERITVRKESTSGQGEKIPAQGRAEVALEIRGKTLRLPLKRSRGVPRGVAGVSVGLPGQPFLDLPTAGKIFPVSGP